ncbi:D-alanyl-D-alanine dipeptidase [Streptomyces violascens]|nr:D-alanyl-D-alanine dipeptidase [Streptomyces violascens]
MADARSTQRVLVDNRKQDSTGAFAHLLDGVLERLLHAQALLPDGIRLLVIEGYRPPSLQREYFEEYAAELRTAHPKWTGEQIRHATSRYVSPPEIAPHSAGAAVDLTLVGPDGLEMDMGVRVNASPEESNGACYTHADTISPQARGNRDLLGTALSAAGFCPYETEFWHWSFGERYWALMTNSAAARYGPQDWP